MNFVAGFAFGVFFGIILTFGAIGVGQILADRRRELEKREWHEGMDALLRGVGEELEQRRRRNDEKVIGAVREVVDRRNSPLRLEN